MTSAKPPFVPRKMTHCNVHRPDEPNQLLDTSLAVWFPRPHSFTGEDIVELHVHGGPAVVRSVFSSLSSLPHFRPSLPGEFSRRAFDNEKMDLTEAEGLSDLIHAETETQRSLALQQMKGLLKLKYSSWRSMVLSCLSSIEAYIDFGEDEHIESDILTRVQKEVNHLASDISSHVNDGLKGQIIRDGLSIAISGPPNAGKSSLLNFLAKRDAAIVSPIPGTTRDVIQVSVQLGGQAVTFHDTAGIRPLSLADPIEKLGIQKSLECMRASQLTLWMMDLHQFDDAATEQVDLFLKYATASPAIVLVNKMDLLPKDSARLASLCAKLREYPILGVWAISLYNLDGMSQWLDDFQQLLVERYHTGLDALSDYPLITNERHRYHLTKCLEKLGQAMSFLPKPGELVLAAEELRHAAHDLGLVTGQVIHQEEILDAIFREFCIGK